LIASWDPAAVAAGQRSPIVPVVALDAGPDALRGQHEPGPIEAGDVLFTWSR
jgi:PTS system glucose-specific IIA component